VPNFDTREIKSLDCSEPYFNLGTLAEWDIALGTWFDDPTNVDLLPHQEDSSGLEVNMASSAPSLQSFSSFGIDFKTTFEPSSADHVSLGVQDTPLPLNASNTIEQLQFSCQKTVRNSTNTMDVQQHARIVGKPKKWSLDDRIPGTMCFPQWASLSSSQPPPKKARTMTATQKKKRQQVKETGACLRCRMYKISVGSPSL
jgi:hypothetical protein